MRYPTSARHVWWDALLFGASLVVATTIYVATHNPFAAALLPCLHGGWHSFFTGLWVLRSDPQRARARICFAFFLAAACWKAAAAALISMMAMIAISVQRGIQPNADEGLTMALVLLVGLVFNTLLGLVAIAFALAYRLRIWVHPRLRADTEGKLSFAYWLTFPACGFNHAIFVVATALIFPAAFLGCAILGVIMVGKPVNAHAAAYALIEVIVLVFGGSFAMIFVYAWLSSRIIARTPAECWPDLVVQTAAATAE